MVDDLRPPRPSEAEGPCHRARPRSDRMLWCVDAGLLKHADEAEKARELLRECEAMETEIALLKNKRTPAEVGSLPRNQAISHQTTNLLLPRSQRLTIEEAYSLLESQELRMAATGPATKATELRIKQAKATIRAHKQATEDLARRARDMQREQAEREASGNRDERAEEGCRWITGATALYSGVLGIRGAWAVGSPVREVVVEYEALEERREGDVRRLSIQVGEGGELVGAQVSGGAGGGSPVMRSGLADAGCCCAAAGQLVRVDSGYRRRLPTQSGPPRPGPARARAHRALRDGRDWWRSRSGRALHCGSSAPSIVSEGGMAGELCCTFILCLLCVVLFRELASAQDDLGICLRRMIGRDWAIVGRARDEFRPSAVTAPRLPKPSRPSSAAQHRHSARTVTELPSTNQQPTQQHEWHQHEAAARGAGGALAVGVRKRLGAEEGGIGPHSTRGVRSRRRRRLTRSLQMRVVSLYALELSSCRLPGRSG